MGWTPNFAGRAKRPPALTVTVPIHCSHKKFIYDVIKPSGLADTTGSKLHSIAWSVSRVGASHVLLYAPGVCACLIMSWQLYCLFNSSFRSQQRKLRSSALLTFCGEMHRWLIYSGHRGTAQRKALIYLGRERCVILRSQSQPTPSPSDEEFIRNSHYRHHTCSLRTESINLLLDGFVIVNFTPNYR